MTSGEQKLMAAYANTFREMAAICDDPDVAQRRLLTAKSFERHLSRDLTEQHERRALGAPHRASEQDELTREQETTVGQLAGTFDSVSPREFLPDGSVLAHCLNLEDGQLRLVHVALIEPGGVPF